MNENHKNRKTIRLQTWDYRWSGSYFITICTHDRNHYFGEIINGKMQLSQVGVIADILWHEIKNRAKNIELGEFVVMPNHIHGILILNGDNTDVDNVGTTDVGILDNVGTGNNVVGTGHALSLHSTQPGQHRFQNIGKNSISSIVGGYKSAVTKHANRLGFEFGWQPRFHDHIIRDEKSFDFISDYIIHNPEKWEEDKFYNKNS